MGKNTIDATTEALASQVNGEIMGMVIQQSGPLTGDEIAELNRMFGDGYDWSQEEDWYTIEDFKTMIDEGMIHWDHGGIVRVQVNGQDTNYHLGIWMLHKEDEKSEPITIEQLNSWHTANHNVTVEWANK